MKDIFITTMIQSAEPQNNEFDRRYGFTYTSGKGSQQDHVSTGNKPGIQISIDHFHFSMKNKNQIIIFICLISLKNSIFFKLKIREFILQIRFDITNSITSHFQLIDQCVLPSFFVLL